MALALETMRFILALERRAVRLIPLSRMVDILAAPFTRSVMSKRSSLTVFCAWVSRPRSQRNPFQLSGSAPCFFQTIDSLTLLAYRQRREHRIFGTLLRMVPGLEDRLLESEDETVVIAEMVGLLLCLLLLANK